MKPGSCGKEFLGDSVDILDEEGNPVPPGVAGNLVVKRPFPMMIRTLWKDHTRYINEYFKRFPGCYLTYDCAVRDKDGYYWVLGRLDDVINVAGHRLSTMEIENAILTCVEISEAAVVGCPNEAKGLVPAAFVRLRGEVVDSATIAIKVGEAVERQIGKIAIPEYIFVVDALPKTPSGKIMRRVLRDLILTGKVQGDVSGLEDIATIEAIRSAVIRE
jgi:acetyl-CoA synthetase